MSTSSPTPPPPAARTRIGSVRIAVGLCGTAGLLGALLARVDLDAVVQVFARVRWSWLSVGLALYLVLLALRVVRYRSLAPEASVRVLIGVHFVHPLLLRVMPFRTGELGFAWLMRRHGAGGFTKNLVGVLLLRVLDLTTVVVVFAVGLAALETGSTHRALGAPLAAALVAALAPLYLRGAIDTGHRVLAWSLRVLRLNRVGAIRRADASLAEAVRWSNALPRALLWRMSGLTTLQWAVNFALFGVLLTAMRVEVTVAQTLVGGTGSVLGGLLPLAGIGNFGPLEAGWSVAFEAAGLDRDLAIASAFAYSVISFGYAALSGVAGWILLPPRRREEEPPAR